LSFTKNLLFGVLCLRETHLTAPGSDGSALSSRGGFHYVPTAIDIAYRY
jgi:hypothetical protein